jgi:hypothetical protein
MAWAVRFLAIVHRLKIGCKVLGDGLGPVHFLGLAEIILLGKEGKEKGHGRSHQD